MPLRRKLYRYLSGGPCIDNVRRSSIDIDPSRLAAAKIFFEKLNELLETEEEVEFTPFKLEDFGNSEIEPKNLPVYLIEK